jgi:hypothetical protein
MKLHIVPLVIASLALGVASPAFAQTSTQPDTQQPVVQDQAAPAPIKAKKAKGQKMAKAAPKAHHAKAKMPATAPAAPASQD